MALHTATPFTENRLSPNQTPPSRSPSPGSDTSPYLSRRHINNLLRQTSNSGSSSRRGSSTGYEQYQKSLLEVPISLDYGDASSDDLSSEWDSDAPGEPLKTTRHLTTTTKVSDNLQGVFHPVFMKYFNLTYYDAHLYFAIIYYYCCVGLLGCDGFALLLSRFMIDQNRHINKLLLL